MKALIFAPIFLAAFSAAAQRHDPLLDLAAMNVAEGYEVNLFASEEQGVVKPIQIRFDAQGRLWVVGSTVYPQIEPGQVPDDKVVVLEDTTGDGRADKSSVFADGLMIPTGLELGDGGVYIGQGTTLLHLKDTTGDGKADQRRVVLRGFGTGDSHQTINSFTWSPGGELLMCQGLHAMSRVETPWGIERLHSAGVWRFHPRLLKLVPFLNEEMGPQNPFGLAFDRWGAALMAAGNGQGIYYLTPAMIRAPKHRTLPWIWNKGRKFGGGEFVENSHFPEEAQGQFISGSYLNNAVYRFQVIEDGSGFRVDDLPPLITSSSTSFRIVDVRFGPDGALYLCDWYNAVIGHYQASFRHPDRDKTRGRIWRVTAKDRPLVARPDLAGASVEELFEQIKSPERWNRQLAKRVLADKPADEVLPPLAAWTAGLDAAHPDYEHHLFEALGVFESHETPEPALLQKLLAAEDHRARANGARAIGRWATRLENPLELLAPPAGDPHPRVRLEAVVAASYIPEARAVEVALQAADQPLDSFIEYALAQTIHTLKPHWQAAFLAGRLRFEGKRERLEYLIKTDASRDTLADIVSRVKGTGLDRATREVFLQIIAEVGEPPELALLLRPDVHTVGIYDPALHADVLRTLHEAAAVRAVRPQGDLTAALKPLVESDHIGVRAQAFHLAGLWRLEGLWNAISSGAFDASADLNLRRAAVEALGKFGADSLPQLEQIYSARDQPLPIQSAAVIAMTGHDLKKSAQFAGQLLAEEMEEAVELFSAFLQRAGGAASLAGELRHAAIAKRNAEIGLELMGATGRRHEELARVLSEAAGFKLHLGELSSEDIAQVAVEVRERGNALRGAEIYARPELSCAACHAINGIGGTLGPDMGSLGTAQPIESIIEAVLYPEREVKEGYLSTSVLTHEGEEYHGYLVRESNLEVVLKDPLQQREIRIRRDTIQEKREHGSLMPPGLSDTLTLPEFRDLIRFLSDLGRPGSRAHLGDAPVEQQNVNGVVE